MTSLELAKKAAAFLDNKKAERVHVIEIENISSLADYFVIATGNNNTHVRALADELEEKLKGEGLPPARVEGYRSNSWILLDWAMWSSTSSPKRAGTSTTWTTCGQMAKTWSGARAWTEQAGFLRSPRPGRPLRSERRAFSPAARGETGPRENKTALGKGAIHRERIHCLPCGDRAAHDRGAGSLLG